MNERSITRRQLIAAAIGTAIPLFISCTPNSRDIPISNNQSITEWNKLSTNEKLQQLELKKYPLNVDRGSDEELRSTTVDFFCENAPCKFTTNEIKQRIISLPSDEFDDIYRKDTGLTYGTKRDEDFVKGAIEFVSIQQNKVYVNQDRLEALLDKMEKSTPKLISQLAPKDLRIVAKKSILIHELSHLNQSFDPFTIRPDFLPSKVKLSEFTGFCFNGIDNGQKVTLWGSREAATEYVATLIGQQTGNYLSLGTGYSDGVRLIEHINNHTEVHPYDFKDYYFGEKKINELLKRWGSRSKTFVIPEDAALLAMMYVSFRVQAGNEFASQQQTMDMINEALF